MTTYKDLTRGCVQTAEKLYTAARPSAPRYPWRLELSGQTAGIMFGPNPYNHAQHQQWTLNLPSIPLDARMTTRERDLWAGYTIHETGHACFTDFGVWQVAIREGVQDLVNALEDVRIERQTIASGVAANAQGLLEALASYMLEKALAQGFDPAQPQGFAFCLAIYGRAIVGGYNLPALPALSPALAKSWAWIWPELTACQSTQDILALARKISKRQKAAENRAKNAQQAQPQEGEEEEAQQGAQAAPQGDDAPQEEAQAQPQKSGRTRRKPDAPQGDAQTSFGAPGVEPDLKDIARAINERMGKTDADLRADETLGTMPAPRVIPVDVAQEGRPDMLPHLEKIYPSLSKLKADLQRLVRSPDRIAITRGQTAGRLDRRAYSRALTGAADVFARRSYAEGVNAAVSIVLDASSSMDEKGKLTYAAAMALAVGDALDRAGVAFEIIAAGLQGHPYGGGALVEIRKPFAATWRKQRPLIGRTKVYPGTANLIASEYAAGRLIAQRDATRRLLFVLSDGEDFFLHTDKVWRRSVDLWAKQGIETIGVGLLHDVSPYFPDSVNIMDPADLAREGLGIVARRLKSAA